MKKIIKSVKFRTLAVVFVAVGLIAMFAIAPEPETFTESTTENVKVVESVATGVDVSKDEAASSDDPVFGFEKHWYEDIDPSQPLPKQPNYSKYDLLNTLNPGDVIFDPTGFGHLTGHIIMVDGVRHDAKYGDYILASEASGFVIPPEHWYKPLFHVVKKVFHSVIDADRIDASKLQVYRVKDATPEQRATAVNFELAQIGKPYSFDYFSFGYNIDRSSWYCSELAWAGYKSQGIEIRNQGSSETKVAVTPRDVSVDSQAVQRIAL
ncbi:MAG: hypothetical protein LBB07_03300 [Bifidobacteriaceae bacterium]|nr:hypothetical protein [Bifidobacteriaceae bacterium]